MLDPITSSDVIAWLVAIIAGGLAGSALSIAFQKSTARRLMREKEASLISALRGELERGRLLCQYNAKLQSEQVATFISFPTIAAIRATFEERHSFPKLAPFIKNLEYYTLAILQLNQMIEHYTLLTTLGGAPGYHVSDPRDDLRNQICSICDGTGDLKGTGPENFIRLPTYIELVSSKIAPLTET
ncbi:MAG TPA: hypothetical protein VJK02_08790 [Anaerolineales bacterium]|nr:hypothetical protein [Anaerolineales bacterium]